MTKKRKTAKAENKNSNQKKIEELENTITESNEKYLRLLAEWENYRKRTTKEKSMSIEYGKELIISKIIPVLDDCVLIAVTKGLRSDLSAICADTAKA